MQRCSDIGDLADSRGIAGLIRRSIQRVSPADQNRDAPSVRLAHAIRHARRALELARRELADGEPNEVIAASLAIVLYRDAALQALCALNARYSEPDLDALIQITPVEVLVRASASWESAAAGLRREFEAEYAHTKPGLAASDELVAGLVAQASALRRAHWPTLPRRAVRRLIIASCSFILLVIVVLFLPPVRALWHPLDLARGHSWVASSAQAPFATERGVIAGNPNNGYFFHTQEEASPWLEVDLDTAKISSVEVWNRADCCASRAVPLVVEISTDRAHWLKVAERSAPFHRWRARFSPTIARWVRFRALRKTSLHLEKVAVY
jgi:F5/8 type C domain